MDGLSQMTDAFLKVFSLQAWSQNFVRINTDVISSVSLRVMCNQLETPYIVIMKH